MGKKKKPTKAEKERKKQIKLVRLANALHRQFSAANRNRDSLVFSGGLLDSCRRGLRRVEKARDAGLKELLPRISIDTLYVVADLRRSLRETERSLNNISQGSNSFTQGLGSIYRDLVALQKNFNSVEFDLREKTISVVTIPIILREIDLGPFEIYLRWGHYSNSRGRPYDVIALDPNPAAADSNVTHPHVCHNELCEGDATEPLAHALRQGRIFDFFVIMANTLGTYNDGSPHIPLSNWHLRACPGCDCSTSDLEDCEDCGVSRCIDCLAYCEMCDNKLCGSCTRLCSTCGAVVCGKCLAGPSNKCGECADEAKKEEPRDSGTDGVATTPPASNSSGT